MDSTVTALLDRYQQGEEDVVHELFTKTRARLRKMIFVRMDPRIAARVDPSDVVQDTLIEATKRLPEFARDRPIPFHAWIRRLGWEKMLQIHRMHIRSQKRSVTREQKDEMQLKDESVLAFVECLFSDQQDPAERIVRSELISRMRRAIAQLSQNDQEILTLRFLEELTTEESAEILQISIAAVKTRTFRAVSRLNQILNE